MSLHRARRGMLVAILTLAALALTAPARADTVTQWNQFASNALSRDAGQGAISSVHLAMVNAAVYDAVNAIDRRYEPYLVAPRAKRWYSQDAAAATAAYRVLVNDKAPVVTTAQLPGLVAYIKPLYDTSLAAIPDGAAKAGGIAVGNAAADAMIAARTGDGRFGSFQFTAGTEPGQWRPEPAFDPGAWLKDVKPFVVDSASQFAGRPPLRLTSRRYAREFNEVKTLGGKTSTVRTPDQTAAGEFWGLTNATATWSSLIRSIADQHPAPLADHARLFAMIYMSAADALITVWADKALYSFWRPITAIREALNDGNPDTAPDATTWVPLVPTPPYPDQPSGLSALGAAAIRSLQDFYGTDEMTFGATNVLGASRSYTSLSQAIEEIVNARVWSGTHFRFADEQGERIGRKVARYTGRNVLAPLGDPDRHHGRDAEGDGHESDNYDD
jgi:hypothetical protein